jgi:hypothetical protein
MVVALLALFIALGGTSYAVIKLPKNSVGSREIKNRSIKSADLAPATRIGKRGPRGAQGPAGPSGSSSGSGTAGPAEAWTPLTFAGAWKSYGGAWPTAAYRRDADGRVHLRGLTNKKDTDPTPRQEDTIAVLPPAYAPDARLLFTVMMSNQTEERAGRVDVLANGSIVWESGPAGPGSYTSLDPISFPTN